MNKWLKITGIVGAVALVGAVVIGVAFAQGPENGPPFGRGFGGKQGFEQRGGPFGGPGGGGFLRNEEMKAHIQETIANVLGLTVEELEAAHQNGQTLEDLAEQQGVDMADIQAAMEEIKQAALDQAVADGVITQEQADAIAERGFGGPGQRRGPRDGFGGPQGAKAPLIEGLPEQIQAAVANTLGLSVEELEAAKADGQNLKDLAEQQGVDMADIEAAVQAAHEAAIDQAVADGTITQEQADRMKERQTNGPCEGPGRVPGPGGNFGGPRGGFGGFGSPQGGFGGPDGFQGQPDNTL